MTEAIAIIAVLGLSASNVYLVHVLRHVKLMEKAKDLAEYKEAIKPPKKQVQSENPIEVPLY